MMLIPRNRFIKAGSAIEKAGGGRRKYSTFGSSSSQLTALFLALVMAVSAFSCFGIRNASLGLIIFAVGFVLIVIANFSLEKRRKYLEEESIKEYLRQNDIPIRD